MKNILVVDDSPETYAAVQSALGYFTYKCRQASTCQEALSLKDKSEFDLLVFDICLPDGDGLSLMSNFLQDSKYSDTPAIVLSSLKDITAKISAFSLGAEDYITKPFNLLEFKARVDSKLRSQTQGEGSDSIFNSPPFRLNLAKQKLTLTNKNESVALTATEFRILALLIKGRETTFTRKQIIELACGGAEKASDRTIDSHIYSLRKKIGVYSRLIKAIAGEGYRLAEFPERQLGK